MVSNWGSSLELKMVALMERNLVALLAALLAVA